MEPLFLYPSRGFPTWTRKNNPANGRKSDMIQLRGTKTKTNQTNQATARNMAMSRGRAVATETSQINQAAAGTSVDSPTSTVTADSNEDNQVNDEVSDVFTEESQNSDSVSINMDETENYYRIPKYLMAMTAIYYIFAVGACIGLAIAILTEVRILRSVYFLLPDVLPLGNLLGSVGLVAPLGIVVILHGAIKGDKKPMMKGMILLYILMFMSCIFIAFATPLLTDMDNKAVRERLAMISKSYNESYTEEMEAVQTSLKCCGSEGYSDWIKTSMPRKQTCFIPMSCCVKNKKCNRKFPCIVVQENSNETAGNSTSVKSETFSLPFEEAQLNVYLRGCNEKAVKIFERATVWIALYGSLQIAVLAGCALFYIKITYEMIRNRPSATVSYHPGNSLRSP